MDPDQTAPDQSLHCLPFRLHLLGTLLFHKQMQKTAITVILDYNVEMSNEAMKSLNEPHQAN